MCIRDRHRQAAYENFSIKRRFRQSISRFSRFKETCARGHQSAVPRKSRYFTVVGQYITESITDERFSRVNIDDFIRPWTSKIRFFFDFCDFRLQRILQEWTAKKCLEIDWQFANRNCYRLSRVSWALAQIFFISLLNFFWMHLLYVIQLRMPREKSNRCVVPKKNDIDFQIQI